MTKGLRKRRVRTEAHRRLLGPAPLIVGLDLARSFHVAAFLERDGTPVCRSLRIPHSRTGVERLVGHAEKLRREHNLEKAIFFMESTGAYWMNVAGVLEEYGVAYRLVHGIAVRNARKMRDYTPAKDDLRDAEIVGHLGIMGRVVDSQLPTERLWIELGGLAVERYELTRRHTAELVRLDSLLGIVLPEVFEVFSGVKGVTLRALAGSGLMPAEIVGMSLEDFIESVRGSCGRSGIYGSKLGELYHLLKSRERLFGVERLVPGIRRRIVNCSRRLELCEAEKREVERDLVVLYGRTPYYRILESFVGTSSLTQATTLGLLGDPGRFPDSGSAVKLAGLDIPAKESGGRGGKTEISHVGRSRLRGHVVRTGHALGRVNGDFRTFAEHLRHKRRLNRRQIDVACGAKYLRAVTAMCRSGEGYRSSMMRGEVLPEGYEDYLCSMRESEESRRDRDGSTGVRSYEVGSTSET